MLHMNPPAESLVLSPAEHPVARVWNPDGQGACVLICEHASAFIPASLNALGLDAAAQRSHAAWDIGALDLARMMSDRLDAPLVTSCVSRLVYDCNRPPEAPDAIPVHSERYDIPGNAALDYRARAARIRDVYLPFEAMIRQVLDACTRPRAIVTIHSFTPVYNGATRKTDIGILHDRDDRLAQDLLAVLQADTDWSVALNQPYSATDGVTHTLRQHALPRGVANVMLEIRNDLIADGAGVARIGAVLVEALVQCLPAAPSPAERAGA